MSFFVVGDGFAWNETLNEPPSVTFLAHLADEEPTPRLGLNINSAIPDLSSVYVEEFCCGTRNHGRCASCGLGDDWGYLPYYKDGIIGENLDDFCAMLGFKGYDRVLAVNELTTVIEERAEWLGQQPLGLCDYGDIISWVDGPPPPRIGNQWAPTHHIQSAPTQPLYEKVNTSFVDNRNIRLAHLSEPIPLRTITDRFMLMKDQDLEN